MASPSQGTSGGPAAARMSALYRAATLGVGFGQDWVDEISKRLRPGETVLLTTAARTEYDVQSAGVVTFRGGGIGLKLLGLLVLTDGRAILFAKRPLHGFVVQEFPYDAVTMVEEMRGWTSSGMRIHAASAVRDLDLMPKDDVPQAVQILQERMDAARRTRQAPPTAPSAGPSPLEALKLRLARGEISPEEYERLRKLLE